MRFSPSRLQKLRPTRDPPLRKAHTNSVTVSAGDTIGASPLISAYYLDEPTIEAMNLLGLEFDWVGNHEFDCGIIDLDALVAWIGPGRTPPTPSRIRIVD